MCATHTSRRQRHGGTEAFAKKSGVQQGWSGKSWVGTSGHLRTVFYGVECYVHHLVYLLEHGSIPRGMHIHHIDHDKLNNDPANLIAMTPSEHHKYHRNMETQKAWEK